MPDSDSEEEGYSDIFTEPEGFREAEKQPTFETYRLRDGRELSLRMIGHSALWVGFTTCFVTSIHNLIVPLLYLFEASTGP